MRLSTSSDRRIEPWLIAGLCAAAAVGLGILLWRRPRFEPDFVVLWRAAQHLFGPLYVFKASAGQYPPFGYPPTLLLALTPFARMGLEPSYLAWTAVSVLAFTAAGAMLAGRLTPLAFVAPPAVFALVTGQTTLLVGAGLIAGLALLPKRPWLAGVLLGLALSIKPQIGFLAPVGLVVGGHWRSLASTALTGLVLAVGAAAVFGPAIWWDWLRALPALDAYGQLNHLQTISLAANAGIVVRLALIAAGAAFTALAFRQPDVVVRLMAAAGASLLCAPHAMGYDTAVLAPCALALLARRSWARAPAAAYMLGFAATPVTLAVFVALCGSTIMGVADRRAPFPALRLPRLDRRASL